MNSLVIGSRGSQLARAQSNSIAAKIRTHHPDLVVHIKEIKTTGDKFANSLLSTLAGEAKGLFVKEIEEALLEGSIDLAVHSLKDVPTALPEGLCLGATPEREEPWDAFVSTQPVLSLDELAQGARIGTSSLRRKIQLAIRRPDLEIVPLRGNIDTRIRKLREEQLDGIILAAAGLSRLKMDTAIAFRFSADEMVPAIGQGCLALEVREQDSRVMDVIKDLNHSITQACVSAERVFLDRMGGGCQVPMGAYAVIRGNHSEFAVFVASESGKQSIRETFIGKRGELMNLVDEAVNSLLTQGGARLLGNMD